MLINASDPELSRVAIVEDGVLDELSIESAVRTVTRGNIYKGRVSRVEPSLQAAFIEYGANRNGFLPIAEIHPDYWKEGVDKNADPRTLKISDVLEPGREILVQVVKEERGTKGAALTTYITLAGRYLVLHPNSERHQGISRKLSEEERRAVRAILKQLDVPEGMGVIVRTAGRDQKLAALERDLTYLRRLWDEIRVRANRVEAPALIYMEGDLATRAIRDHYTEDIDEIWVDDPEVYARVKEFVHAVIPGKERTVKLYRGRKPLFRHFGIEAQCEVVYAREVKLPSGGSIVIDTTEALTAVDVNSARATSAGHIDETALQTNLEAAHEIARQLRIRDIGGLVVVDFIDMPTRQAKQKVEEALREACERDKARIQIGRISRFGLLELSRQRLHPSVEEVTADACPRCHGSGKIPTVEAMAVRLLSHIEDWAERGRGPQLVVQAPSDVGEYLINEKRDQIARIEEQHHISVSLQIRPDLFIPHYRIERHYQEGAQQKIEVLEDTTKVKKPPRGKKLKESEPIVGLGELMRDEAKQSTPWWAQLWTKIKALWAPKPKKKPAKKRRKRKKRTSNQRRRR
ncbi:MAG: Rne/Rng family ribonuclease, partial [Zetaproteobacteria bacterium]